ncbi:type II toxin-antitoxin system RelE/ParE family toxin [Rouxiella aceris]|uniref:type II toxin-antitoxin system RelE/ParE family toxin n=1 Tax=Rouxiella aceris TaxID=2703884 RepID=UPI001F2CE8FB|nr:type II toxin-antitoxin system RelE/ParE family toxin [Rouxiella aceris]
MNNGRSLADSDAYLLSQMCQHMSAMPIEWDESAVQDRERIFEFLYPFNARTAEITDE